MRFLVPGASDPKNAEETYESIRKFAVQTTGNTVLPPRIFRLSYRHERIPFDATVGQPDERLGETVVAILEGAATYLVCTLSRGVQGGLPLLVSKDDVTYIEKFTPE